jgi:hypothetical protein
MSNDLEQKNNEVMDPAIFEGMDSGFEGTDASTFKTPFAKILQALSPEVDEDDPKYIPNSRVGDFCNSASQQLYKSIEVVVLKIEHSLIVWKPSRGGFVGRHPKVKEDEIVSVKEGLKKWDSEGNEVVDTIEFFCLNINDPMDIFIFPVFKASLKHGRNLATRLRVLKMDGNPVNVSWAGVWKISTVKESNDQGSWYTLGSTPEFLRFVTKEEVETMIKPAKEILSTAITDYSVIEGEPTEEDTEF